MAMAMAMAARRTRTSAHAHAHTHTRTRRKRKRKGGPWDEGPRSQVVYGPCGQMPDATAVYGRRQNRPTAGGAWRWTRWLSLRLRCVLFLRAASDTTKGASCRLEQQPVERVEMGERTGGFRRLKHRALGAAVLPGRWSDLASNALLAKGVQSPLSPTRIAQALDRGGSALRSKELPPVCVACVEGYTSHCRSLLETPACSFGPIHQLPQ
jgi:hypothetical protein